MLQNTFSAQYVDKIYDSHASFEFLHAFQDGTKRVLDIGCGTGNYAKKMSDSGMEVHGITISPEEFSRAKASMHRAVLANVEDWQPDYPIGHFDLLLFSHVLEHLTNPANAVERLLPHLRRGGQVAVTIPNIAFWRYRLKALAGKFEYEDTGPMDRTHLRFFTYYTIQTLLKDAGLTLVKVEAHGHVPLGPVRRWSPSFGARLDRYFVRNFPNLFGYEVQVLAIQTGRDRNLGRKR
jgi:SAM-dependent methyltransferase